MKKKKEVTIKINFSNRWLYTFIFIGILIIIAVGVYAYGTSTPSTFGHSAGELNFSQAVIGNITATGKISANGICIGSDCKTTWPVSLTKGIAIYQMNHYCENGDSITFVSTCETIVCRTDIGYHYECNGNCPTPGHAKDYRCSNTLKGYLIT